MTTERRNSQDWCETAWLREENERLRAENRTLRDACAAGWGEPTLINTLRVELRVSEERYAALVREIASARAMHPAPSITVGVDTLPGMSPMNRTIAYCAADTLRKLGYAWNGEAWVQS